MSERYTGKEFPEGTPVIRTERGERVRSKSEKILADYCSKKDTSLRSERHLSRRTSNPDIRNFKNSTGYEADRKAGVQIFTVKYPVKSSEIACNRPGEQLIWIRELFSMPEIYVHKMAEEERKDILWRRFISLADHPVLEKVP